MAKLAGDGKLTRGEDIWLYCEVLKNGGTLEEARAVAESPMAEKGFPVVEERLKVGCEFLLSCFFSFPDSVCGFHVQQGFG